MKKPWPIIKLASAPVQIIDGDRGKNYPKHGEFADSGYCLFLNAGNVTTDGFNFSDCQFISEGKDQKLRKGKLIPLDVVMTTRGTVGNIGLNNENVPYDNIRINSGMVIFRPDPIYLSSDYFYHYLRSPLFKNQVNALKSGVAQPQLPIRDINHINMALPPRDEQEQISNILSAYDDLIENNRRRIELLEQAARLLYEEWFVQLRFPGHEHVKKVDGIPEDWDKKTAYEAMEIYSGGTPSTTDPEYWGEDIPFYTPKDHSRAAYVLDTERSITEKGLSNCNSKLYGKNTIFMSARGTVGKIIMAQRPMAMSQTSYALIGKNNVTQLFLYVALQQSLQQYKQRASGAVFDAIIVDTYKIIPFIIPSKTLIKEYEAFATPIFTQMENLLLSNRNLRQARNLLIPRLMSGEIAV